MSGRPLACFDLDNTLVDRQAAYLAWVGAFVAARCLPAAAFDRLVELDQDGFASREEVFGPLREEFGLADSVAELIAAYRVEYPPCVPKAPESAAALERLRGAGFLVALVTNGPPSQRDKIVRAGLEGAFDAVCISDELGIAKPDPAIFREAARRCGTTLEQVRGSGWMVGDSPSTDVGGGRAAGLRTVWLRRGRTWDLEWYEPDVVVGSVDEAVTRLLDGSEERTRR